VGSNIAVEKLKSVRNQYWVDRCLDEDRPTALQQHAGLDALTARLLAGRDIEPENAQSFLKPRIKDQLPDPSIMQDMDKAADLIIAAILVKKSITVFADYDVDGGTSAAQLIRWGRAMGAEFDLYVPDRVAEGYGPSVDAFHKLKDNGAELVITVDCGAASVEALEAAREIDLPIIVVDHHLMEGELPHAQAIINPNRPDDESGLGHLAAAGVVFMLLVALNRKAKDKGLKNAPNLMNLLGLTALGTVCDVVSLTGINRVFVAQGMKVLSQGHITGISALADVANVNGQFNVYHAGFVFGPRINAGGRIGRADMGAELLSTENAQLAYAHAAELDRVNTQRKAMQAGILMEALQAASSHKDDPVIIVDMEGWHPGIIGIVAGRLKEQYTKPAIVIGINDEGLGKGSGRSIKGVNLGGAIVAAKQCGLLVSGGGHAMAGGLSVKRENIEAFRAFICEHLDADVMRARENLALNIDSWLTVPAVEFGLLDIIDSVGPYGAGNPAPVFAFENMRIAYTKALRGGHIRCSFEDIGGARLSGICFRGEETGLSEILLDPTSPRVHVAGRLKRNEWKGRVSIDFELMDIIRIP